MPVDARAQSLRTKREIWGVIRKYNLNPEILREYGLPDRRARAQILLEKQKVRASWNPRPKDVERGVWKATVEVDSLSRKKRGYIVGIVMEKIPNEISRELYKNFAGKAVYEIMDYPPERVRKWGVPSHECEDGVYQDGIKFMPTVCMHRIAAGIQIYRDVSEELKQSGMPAALLQKYGELSKEEMDFYKELQHHDLRAAERLDNDV